MTDSSSGEMVVSSTTNPASVLPEEDDDRSDDHDVHVASSVYGNHGHHHRNHSTDEPGYHIHQRNHGHHLNHLHHTKHQQLHSNDVDIDSTTNDQMHFVLPSVSPASEPMTPGVVVSDVSAANQAPSAAPPSPAVRPPVAVEVDIVPYSDSQNHHLVQFYDHNQLSNQSMGQHHASTSSSSHHHVYQQSSSAPSFHMYQMDPNPNDSCDGNLVHHGSSSSYLPSIAHQQHSHQVIRIFCPLGSEESASHQLSELSNAAHHSSWSQPTYSQSLPNVISLHDEYHSQMLPPSGAGPRTTSQTEICDDDREDLSLNQRSHNHHHQSMNSTNTLVSHHQIMMCDDSMDARLHHDQQQSQIHLHHHLMQSNRDEIVAISDVPVESRARASLPTSYLYIEPVDDFLDSSEAIYGVFARKPIPQRTQFGPVEGVIMQFTGSRNIPQPNLTVFISDSLILDQSDENKSNWMRFVRMATTLEEQNLILITKEQTHPNPENSRELITTTKFFFITTKPIGPKQELKVWYSKEYADRFRLKLLEENIIERPPTPNSEIPPIFHHHHNMNQDHFSDSNILGGRSIADQEQLSIPAPTDHHMIQGHDSHQSISSECFETQPHLDTESRLETSYTSLVPIQSEVALSVRRLTSELQQQQQQQTSSTDLIPAAGHKLRNKIAKSQQQQQLQLQKTQQNNQPIVLEPLKSISDVPSASLALESEAINRKERSSDHRCETCGKTFPRFYSLRRHMIMHSGEKKFKCPVCHMSFSHVYNRNRHVKRHTTNGQSSSDKKKDNSEPSTEPATESTASQPSSSISSKELPKMMIKKIVISNPSTPKPFLTPSVKLIEILQSVTSSNEGGGGGTTDNGDKSGENSSVTNVPESTTPNIIRSMVSKVKKIRATLLSKRFKCNQCYKFFSSDERLKKHILVHSSDDRVKPLSCTICSKRFFNNSALSCHMKIHSSSRDEPRRYECILCSQHFDCNSSRRDHVSTHLDASGQLTCPVCKKKFHEFPAIRKHIRGFHSGKRFPCSVCEKVFPRPDKLKLHMLSHSNRREFLCQSCGKQFKRKDKLKEHIQRMHSADRDARLARRAAAKTAVAASENRYNSNGSNDSSSNVTGSKKFVPKVSPNDYHRFIYKCHSCLLGFKRRGMLVNHLAKRHPETSPTTVPELNLPILKTTRDYYCQYCDKVYKSSSKRKSHILKNHPGLSLPVSSRIRGSGGLYSDVVNPTYSATVGSITTHPHSCDWCHKQYASKAKLLQHQRKKHPDEMENSSLRVAPRKSTGQVNRSSSTRRQQAVSNQVMSVPTTDYPMNDPVSGPTTQNHMDSTLIAFLGNIVNSGTSGLAISGSTTSTETVAAADRFQELLQSNPTVANDLLTQAMSELTNTSNQYSKESQVVGNQHQVMISDVGMNWS